MTPINVARACTVSLIVAEYLTRDLRGIKGQQMSKWGAFNLGAAAFGFGVWVLS